MLIFAAVPVADATVYDTGFFCLRRAFKILSHHEISTVSVPRDNKQERSRLCYIALSIKERIIYMGVGYCLLLWNGQSRAPW